MVQLGLIGPYRQFRSILVYLRLNLIKKQSYIISKLNKTSINYGIYPYWSILGLISDFDRFIQPGSRSSKTTSKN